MNQISAFKGKIDRLDASSVAGWAKSEETPSEPLELEVFYGDTHLGDVTANESRQDLSRAGIGDCAFTFKIPALDDFEPDELMVVVKGTDIPLKRSWAPNLSNTREVRGELAELSETLKLTRKVLLAASSRNERALIGMADTVEKVTPRQLNETLNTLSYQIMRTQRSRPSKVQQTRRTKRSQILSGPFAQTHSLQR
ncbi:hypothetical protein [Roseibium sp.]|uniref:hypothetical protein n=1 Tax=Roseibium sp. TaxID=1936156 RepID=UPI003B5113D9